MECEFKFIQQWRAKLLFHIEQQLNNDLSFFIPGIGIHESAGSFFISPDTCFCILHELLPARDFRLLPMQCVSHFSFSLQDDSPVNIYVQIHSFQSVLVLQKKHKHLAVSPISWTEISWFSPVAIPTSRHGACVGSMKKQCT